MKTLRLKDLGRWYSGGTPPRDRPEHWDGDLPWISAKDIDSTKLRPATTFITREAALEHSRIVPRGALLLIVRGMALAHGLPVVETEAPVAFNQDLRALVCAPGIEPRFAYYSLIGHRWQLNAHIDQAAHGTARVIDSIFRERVAVPDERRQKVVIDFLDRECARVDDLDVVCREISADSHGPALARFTELVEPWVAGRIGYRFSVQLGKMLNEKRIDPEDVHPYVRNTNVQWDRLELDDLNAMTFSASDRQKYGLRSGDLLVCEGGQPGRSAIWDGQVENCYFQKALMRVRPLDIDSTRYLMWCLRLASERGDFAADGTGTTILHLPAERLIATRVPLPPPEIQRKIVKEVDEIAQRAAEVSTETGRLRTTLTEYRDALITEAVTGQLDVTRLSKAQMEENLGAVRSGERPEALAS